MIDQDVAPGGMPLVVDRDRAPLAAVGAVVDDRHVRRRDLFAGTILEHARVFQDVIGFEAVPARLVEQHAAAPRLARPDTARRRRHRVEER